MDRISVAAVVRIIYPFFSLYIYLQPAALFAFPLILTVRSHSHPRRAFLLVLASSPPVRDACIVRLIYHFRVTPPISLPSSIFRSQVDTSTYSTLHPARLPARRRLIIGRGDSRARRGITRTRPYSLVGYGRDAREKKRGRDVGSQGKSGSGALMR